MQQPFRNNVGPSIHIFKFKTTLNVISHKYSHLFIFYFIFYNSLLLQGFELSCESIKNFNPSINIHLGQEHFVTLNIDVLRFAQLRANGEQICVALKAGLIFSLIKYLMDTICRRFFPYIVQVPALTQCTVSLQEKTSEKENVQKQFFKGTLQLQPYFLMNRSLLWLEIQSL